MSPAYARARAAAAHAAAEAATHPADKAVLRAAARAWERIASPGVPWSHEPALRDLRSLKRDVAVANGPFKAPKAAAPVDAPMSVTGDDWQRLTGEAEVASIQF